MEIISSDIMPGLERLPNETSWKNCYSCIYDTVDFGRQYIQSSLQDIYEVLLDAFNNKQETDFM